MHGAGVEVMLVGLLLLNGYGIAHGEHGCRTDVAPTWPDSFTLVQRRIPDNVTAGPATATTVTYYDWNLKANLIVITPDDAPADVLWDLELDSGHSYYFTPGSSQCTPMRMPVGILRPDWLANATYLGKRVVNGRRCLAWTKADFIDYYADEVTCEPVSWYFHNMKAKFDSIYWAADLRVPDDAYFTPPVYCNTSDATATSAPDRR